MIPRILRAKTTGGHCWMLVDDNEEILSLLGDTVTKIFGVEVAAYHLPSEALAAFQTEPERFECVITDLEMPGMTGFELCDQLHEISPLVPILLATGSQFITPTEARAKGFCGMLPKPFSSAALKREITSLQAEE